MTEQDLVFMQRALALAEGAAEAGEVPVGAVVVRDGLIVGEGANAPLALQDPTAHAEVLALRAAGQCLTNYRLPGCVLYVSLEPCPMCVGAMIHARIERVVFAASDTKTGALGGQFDLTACGHHNHRLGFEGGLLADRSSALLRGFFRARRGRD